MRLFNLTNSTCYNQAASLATYAPHIPRQLADLQAFHADESLLLDPGMDYSQVRGLSEEIKERLQRVRPTNLGAAKRMEGMTPAAAVNLLKHARRMWRSSTSNVTTSI